MNLSRREVLSLAAAQAIRPGLPVPGGAGDTSCLRSAVLALLAGTPASNSRPETAPKLAGVAATARTRLAAMQRARPGELFRGLQLGADDANLTTTYQWLHDIALATRTPGLPEDPDAQHQVSDALALLHTAYFGDQARGYYGNWYNWEIGIPTWASRTLLLLQDVLTDRHPGLTAAYITAMDGYLRHGKDGDVDLDSRFHTGANLADITTNRILQGAVTEDTARIAKAVADQSTVLATIDPYHLNHQVTDGFYADGSYLQHGSVAYTATYGTGLLTRVVQTLGFLSGTSYLPAGANWADTALRWISDGFAPLVFEGWMSDAVKGRAVARPQSGYADTAAVVEAATDLAAQLPEADGERLRGWVKHVHAVSAAPPDPAEFASPLTIVRYTAVLESPLPGRDLLPPAGSHHAFSAMDRTVHRRPGYSFTLARSSRRISGYEYMNGENLLPWFQGGGAHHLLLSGADHSRGQGVDCVTAVEPHQLAGVTAPLEDRRSVPDLYGSLWYDDPAHGFTADSAAQNAYVYFPRPGNAFSGGARLDRYGAAGLVLADDAAWEAKRAGTLPEGFVAYRAARATRSWFFFDDEIAVLSAGVGDGEGAGSGRAVTTSVDTRLAAPDTALSITGELRDGSPWPGINSGPLHGTSPTPLSWLHLSDPDQHTALTYAFLTGPAPTVTLETVTRSQRLVRLANPDTPVHAQVFRVSVDQPPGSPPVDFAHLILPGAPPQRPRNPVRVLVNTPALQAVHHTGLRVHALNAFTPGPHRVAHLGVDGPASVLLRPHPGGGLTLAVADPTAVRDSVVVTVHGRRVTVDTRRSHGRTVVVQLR